MRYTLREGWGKAKTEPKRRRAVHVYRPDGTTVTTRLVPATENDVAGQQKLMKSLMAEFSAKLDDEAKAKFTIGDLVDEWLLRKKKLGLVPSSLDDYEASAKKLKDPRMGIVDIPVVEFTAEDGDDFALNLIAYHRDGDERRGILKPERPLANGTLRKYVKRLRAVLTYARDTKRIISVNPIPTGKKLDGMPKRTRRKRVFSMDEVIQMAQSASRELRAMLLLSALTGMRQGEMRGLKQDGVDWQKKTITILWHYVEKVGIKPGAKTETGEYRVIPVPELALDALKAYIAGKGTLDPSLPFFEREKGWYSRALRSCMGRADIPVWGVWHDLRHTYNTWLQQEGIRAKVGQALMGHASDAMTSHYDHAQETEMREAANILELKAREAMAG